MSGIVADADGLIKLGESGALAALLTVVEVLAPEAVYEEAVIIGKKELYEDAFELERVLREGGARIFSELEDERATEVLEGVTSLGAGERAALHAAFVAGAEAGTEAGADAVLTDDRAFLGILAGSGVRALVPAAAIVLLAGRGAVSVEEAEEALGRIEGSVRREVYEAAMEELAGMRGERMSEAKATGSSRPYPLRIPEGLLELAEAKARTERTDRSTALRQLLYAGAEGYVLKLLGEGRISAGRAAEVLGVSVHRVYELAGEQWMETGATGQDYRRSREAARSLL